MKSTLTSKRYPGLTVRYGYAYSPEMTCYSWRGVFNGATPADAEIEIDDVRVGRVSVYEYLSEQVMDGLYDEIRLELS